MEGGGAWSEETTSQARRCNESFAAGKLEPCEGELVRLLESTGGDAKVAHNAAVWRYYTKGGDSEGLLAELERLKLELERRAALSSEGGAAGPPSLRSCRSCQPPRPVQRRTSPPRRPFLPAA